MVARLRKHDYRCVLGTVYPLDALHPFSWRTEKFILEMAKAARIVILPDCGGGGKRMAQVLTTVPARLAQRGYRVWTVSEVPQEVEAQNAMRILDQDAKRPYGQVERQSPARDGTVKALTCNWSRVFEGCGQVWPAFRSRSEFGIFEGLKRPSIRQRLRGSGSPSDAASTRPP